MKLSQLKRRMEVVGEGEIETNVGEQVFQQLLDSNNEVLRVKVPISIILEALEIPNSTRKSEIDQLAKKLNDKDQALESVREMVSKLEEKANVNEAKLALAIRKDAEATRRTEKLDDDLKDLKKYVSMLEEQVKLNEAKLAVLTQKEAAAISRAEKLEADMKITKKHLAREPIRIAFESLHKAYLDSLDEGLIEKGTTVTKAEDPKCSTTLCLAEDGRKSTPPKPLRTPSGSISRSENNFTVSPTKDFNVRPLPLLNSSPMSGGGCGHKFGSGHSGLTQNKGAASLRAENWDAPLSPGDDDKWDIVFSPISKTGRTLDDDDWDTGPSTPIAKKGRLLDDEDWDTGPSTPIAEKGQPLDHSGGWC